MNTPCFHRRFLWILLAALCLLPPAAAAEDTGLLRAQLVNEANGFGLPAVHVEIEPAAGGPSFSAITDPLGMFRAELPPGAYSLRVTIPVLPEPDLGTVTIQADQAAHRRYRLRVPEVEEEDRTFSLAFQVTCVRSQSPLPGAEIEVTFTPEDPAGPAVPARTVFTDASGAVRLSHLSRGFYEFKVTKTGWEDYSFPAGGVLLEGPHGVLAALKPAGTSLSVTVHGFDPRMEAFANSNQSLSNALVEITGLSFAGDDVETVPTQQGYTDGNGNVRFTDLPAIPWKVAVKKLGYEPVTAIVRPNEADATLRLDPIQLPLHLETKVVARFSIPGSEMDERLEEQASPLLVQFRVTGLEGSASEGVDREVGELVRERTASAQFLLPGRYEVRLESAVYRENPWYREVRLQAPPQIIELADEESRVLEFALEPVPARIQGRILVREEDPRRPDLGAQPTLRGQASSQIEFRRLLRDNSTAEPITVATDAEGFFSAVVPPGLYLVEIPDLAGFSERDLEWGWVDAFGGSTVPLNIFTSRSWPSAVPGGQLELSAGFDYQLNLIIAPNHAHFTGGAFYSYPASLSVGYQDFALFEGVEVALEGPVSQTTLLSSGGFHSGAFAFTNLPPGDYTIRGGPSAFYDFADLPDTGRNFIQFTIPEWSSYPGAFDGAPQNQYIAGAWHQAAPSLSARFKHPVTVPSLEARYWNETDDSYGPPIELSNRFVFSYSLPEYPDVYWESAFVPHIPGLLAHTLVGKWRTHAFSGQERITLFIGGPSDDGRDLAEYTGTQVQFRIRTFLESGDEITGLKWTDEGVELTSGAAFVKVPERTMNRLGLGTVEVPFRVARSATRILSSNPYQAEGFLTVVRDMELSGRLFGAAGEPLTNAALRVFDKLNHPLTFTGSLRTDDQGAFRAGLAGRGDPVMLEITERGYKPFRKLYQPASHTADITGIEITLEPLPPASVKDITLNRFGLFIPGVTKSGDLTDYRAGAAKAALTATWTVHAEAPPITYTVDQITSGQVSPRTVQRDDAIQEIWLIDRKAIVDSETDPIIENIFTGVATNLFGPVDRLLQAISSGQRDGKPFKVAHRRIQVSEPAEDHQYSGELYLPNLPVGLYEPYIVAVTRAGAVAVAPYTYPEGRPPLEGWELPPWIDSGFLNTIGAINNFHVRNLNMRASLEAHFPKGALLPLPEFTGSIKMVPVQKGTTANPTNDNYLDYSYSIGVKSTIGVPTPTLGSVLSIGGAKIGAEAGGKMSLTAKGKEKKVELSYEGFLNKEFAGTNFMDQPALARGRAVLKRIANPKVRAEGKDTMKFTATITELAEKQTISHSHLTFYEVSASFNIAEKAIMVSIPYVGLIFLTLDTFDIPLPLKLELIAKFGGGADHIYTWETVQPRPLNLTTSTGGSPRLHFLGRDGTNAPAGEVSPGPGWDILPSNVETDLLFIAGAELKGTIGADTGAGIGGSVSGVIELGSPVALKDRGVRIKMNPAGDKAPLVEVVGAITGGFNWKLNLLGLQYGASRRWDLLPFKWQFGTEPHHSIYPLPPIEIRTSANVPPAVWVAGSGTIVSNFFDAGALDLSPGAEPALVFTQTDPAGGMKLMLSPWNGSEFASPVTVAETDGAILSAALSRLPAAQAPFGWALCWSEITPEHLGNPMAPALIKCSISTDAAGVSWNPPRQLAALSAPAVQLDLRRTANTLILLWLEPEQTLLDQALAIRLMTSSTLNNWSAPITAFPAANNFVDCQFVTSPEFLDLRLALAARHRDGWLYGWEYRDSDWHPLDSFGERHAIIPALLYDSAGALLKAEFAPSEEALLLSRLNGSDWTELARVESVPQVEHLSANALNLGGDPRLLLSWRTEGLRNELWQAWFDESGATLRPPEPVTSAPKGTIASMLLSPIQTGAALIYQLSTPEGASIRMAALGPDSTLPVLLQFTREPASGLIRLAWPAAAGYTLESTPVLGPAANWQPVQGAQPAAGQYQIQIQPAGQPRFFRLKR